MKMIPFTSYMTVLFVALHVSLSSQSSRGLKIPYLRCKTILGMIESQQNFVHHFPSENLIQPKRQPSTDFKRGGLEYRTHGSSRASPFQDMLGKPTHMISDKLRVHPQLRFRSKRQSVQRKENIGISHNLEMNQATAGSRAQLNSMKTSKERETVVETNSNGNSSLGLTNRDSRERLVTDIKFYGSEMIKHTNFAVDKNIGDIYNKSKPRHHMSSFNMRDIGTLADLQNVGVELKTVIPYEKSGLTTGLRTISKRKSRKIIKRSNALLHLKRNNLEYMNYDSLENLMKRIIESEMKECELIIAIDKGFRASRILEVLVDVPVLKQVVLMTSPEDLALQVEWNSKNCQGTFLLLSDPDPLLDFGNKYKFQWAYKAKVVILGLSPESLSLFAETMKGKKTEHIIGVVEDYANQRFQIFMNLLFWGKGVQQISSWLGHRFNNKATLFPNKVNNLRKGVVKVIMFDWRPIMFTQRDSDGKVIGRYGRDIYVVENLAKVFNFTLSYIDIAQDWGQLLPNGSFTGLVGYLGRDIGHIGIANLYPSALDDRHKFQDYSTPLSEDRVCFLARHDPPLPRWQNPSLPFQQQTWLALFIGFLLAGPILYLLGVASNSSGEEDYRYTNFVDACMATVAIHFEHPLGALPRCLGTRVFAVFLLLYSIIITTGYRGNLIAFLTVTREPKGFETIEELYKSGIPLKSFPWYVSALKHSGNPYLRGLLDRYEIRLTFEELKYEILAGETVHINSRMYLEPAVALVKTKRGKPLLRFLRECLASYSVGLGFAMNSPIKNSINRILARMFESGITIKWFELTNEYYWQVKQKEEASIDYGGDDWYVSTDGIIPLGMDHMQGIFIVYIAGFVLSKITFIVEILTHKYCL